MEGEGTQKLMEEVVVEVAMEREAGQPDDVDELEFQIVVEALKD